MSESMLNAFHAAVLFDLGDKENALSVLKDQDDRFCQSTVRDFELADKNVNIATRNELILLFFGEEEVKFVSCWQRPNVFKNLLNMYVINRKFNLNGNTSKDISQTCTLHKKLKKYMQSNIPNQSETVMIVDGC